MARAIAVCRVVFPKSWVRLSAGREGMSEAEQALCLLAGANSIFVGERLLTTDNPGEDRDGALLDAIGFETAGRDVMAAGSGKRTLIDTTAMRDAKDDIRNKIEAAIKTVSNPLEEPAL